MLVLSNNKELENSHQVFVNVVGKASYIAVRQKGPLKMKNLEKVSLSCRKLSSYKCMF